MLVMLHNFAAYTKLASSRTTEKKYENLRPFIWWLKIIIDQMEKLQPKRNQMAIKFSGNQVQEVEIQLQSDLQIQIEDSWIQIQKILDSKRKFEN